MRVAGRIYIENENFFDQTWNGGLHRLLHVHGGDHRATLLQLCSANSQSISPSRSCLSRFIKRDLAE